MALPFAMGTCDQSRLAGLRKAVSGGGWPRPYHGSEAKRRATAVLAGGTAPSVAQVWAQLHTVPQPTAQPEAHPMQPNGDLPRQPRPWGRVSTIRLGTFSDSVFAIAVTLLALQLHPPNLGGATTAGAVLDALGQELRPFGFYTLAFLVTGR